jgi:hypothetical protein
MLYVMSHLFTITKSISILYGGKLMKNSFSEVKIFQVKPDKLDEFEKIIIIIADEQKLQDGCIDIKYVKRFFTLDGLGNPPRELTKIVKCVKYFSYWELDNRENYGKAIEWFFKAYEKEIQKLLIMPFDINCGNSVY